jgi:hypothetical protein
MAQLQPDVCYVDAQGQLICGTFTATSVDANTKQAIVNAFGPLSDARANLIAALVKQVQEAQITDSCIEARTDDIVQSVRILLEAPPPVMLLYRYVSLPGNIMGAYFVQQGDFNSARAALDDWGILKPGCS